MVRKYKELPTTARLASAHSRYTVDDPRYVSLDWVPAAAITRGHPPPRSASAGGTRAPRTAGIPQAASVTAAGAAATEGTSPANDSFASAWYRREVIGVHLRRLLTGQE